MHTGCLNEPLPLHPRCGGSCGLAEVHRPVWGEEPCARAAQEGEAASGSFRRPLAFQGTALSSREGQTSPVGLAPQSSQNSPSFLFTSCDFPSVATDGMFPLYPE